MLIQKHIPKNKLYEDHLKKFGVNPYIIGVYWRDNDLLEQLIKKAIISNKPYNELDLLNKEERDYYLQNQILI